MLTQSRLLILDLWCDPSLTPEQFQAIVEKLKCRTASEVRVVREVSHRFEPQGETWLAVLSESHCAIHTYPEHHYISIDLYSCNPDRDLEALARTLMEGLPLLKSRKEILARG
jgi:S-adenosylmethionine decarboxylase